MGIYKLYAYLCMIIFSKLVQHTLIFRGFFKKNAVPSENSPQNVAVDAFVQDGPQDPVLQV